MLAHGNEYGHGNARRAHDLILRRMCLRHPRRNGEWLRSRARLPEGMQDEVDLVVHFVSTRNPESLTHTWVEAISNYDLGVENLLGSMS